MSGDQSTVIAKLNTLNSRYGIRSHLPSAPYSSPSKKFKQSGKKEIRKQQEGKITIHILARRELQRVRTVGVFETGAKMAGNKPRYERRYKQRLSFSSKEC